jgi:hypothetical protein
VASDELCFPPQGKHEKKQIVFAIFNALIFAMIFDWGKICQMKNALIA